MLTPKNAVYKMIGPVLVKQEQAEATANVAKRLEFIRSEMYVPSPSPSRPLPPLPHSMFNFPRFVSSPRRKRMEAHLQSISEKSEKKKQEVRPASPRPVRDSRLIDRLNDRPTGFARSWSRSRRRCRRSRARRR